MTASAAHIAVPYHYVTRLRNERGGVFDLGEILSQLGMLAEIQPVILCVAPRTWLNAEHLVKIKLYKVYALRAVRTVIISCFAVIGFYKFIIGHQTALFLILFRAVICKSLRTIADAFGRWVGCYAYCSRNHKNKHCNIHNLIRCNRDFNFKKLKNGEYCHYNSGYDAHPPRATLKSYFPVNFFHSYFSFLLLFSRA